MKEQCTKCSGTGRYFHATGTHIAGYRRKWPFLRGEPIYEIDGVNSTCEECGGSGKVTRL